MYHCEDASLTVSPAKGPEPSLGPPPRAARHSPGCLWGGGTARLGSGARAQLVLSQRLLSRGMSEPQAAREASAPTAVAAGSAPFGGKASAPARPRPQPLSSLPPLLGMRHAVAHCSLPLPLLDLQTLSPDLHLL